MASSETETAPNAPAGANNAAPAPHPAGKAKRILGGLAIAAILFSAYEGWNWLSYGRFHEETDDAYTQADLITVQARDTGYIAEVPIAPNAPVAKDQVIAKIDPEDYRLAEENARNALASAQSEAHQLDAQIVSGKAQVAQAEAALEAARATEDGARKAYLRAKKLIATAAGTQAAVDQAEASAKAATAQVASAAAAIDEAKAALAVTEAKRRSAEVTIRTAETDLKQATRDLGFTEIRAPFAGVLTERQIEPGSYVVAGSRIGTLVPVNDVYVTANFKETQIAGIHPGAKATIRLDAWKKVVLHGTVESLTAGTGQVFSLLPASNATGNFTKVVQRVPVRIAIDAGDRARLPLRPGLSAVVEVDTRTGSAGPLMPAAASAAPSAVPSAAPSAAAPSSAAASSSAPAAGE